MTHNRQIDRSSRLDKVNPVKEGQPHPLHLAAQSGCAEAVKMLVAKGADANPRDSQDRTPLGLAREWHHDTTAELLHGVRNDGAGVSEAIYDYEI